MEMFLFSLLFLSSLFSSSNHVLETSTLTTTYYKKMHHGVELSYGNQGIANEDLYLFCHSSWKQFHNGHFNGSLITGIKYIEKNCVPGVYIAYDLLKISKNLHHQMSYGVEVSKNNMKIQLTDYKPWPRKMIKRGYKISTHKHTDLDFLFKDKYFLYDIGAYKISKKIGLKGGVAFCYGDYIISSSWRYDSLIKNSFQIKISYGLFSSKLNKNNNHRIINFGNSFLTNRCKIKSNHNSENIVLNKKTDNNSNSLENKKIIENIKPECLINTELEKEKKEEIKKPLNYNDFFFSKWFRKS